MRASRAMAAAAVSISSLVLVIGGVSLVGAASASATDKPGQEVCGPLDSGKIDVSGEVKTITVTAPEGYLIDGYCVKAGSDVSVPAGAVVYVTVSPPTATVTFSHPSGKGISHYSVSYVRKVGSTPSPTPTTTSPTPTPTTTSPSPTPTTTSPTPTRTTTSPSPTPTTTSPTPSESTSTPPPLPELPDTGASGITPLLAGMGAALVLAGAALLALMRRHGVHS